MGQAKRICGSRSRSGCITCKTRRVKCDETKPTCLRCRGMHLECGGYVVARKLGKPKSTVSVQRLAPLMPKRPALSPIPVNPSTSIPGDEMARRYFRLFNEKMALEFCCPFKAPTTFWTRLVPQQCHHEPALRHAIFALSALYKSAACNIYAVEKNKSHLQYALLQHSKATRLLRKTLRDDRPRMRVALIASLLFGCFESFHGNWETAIRQIRSGLNILKHLQEDSRVGESQSLAAVDRELGVILKRIKLQILSFLALYPRCDLPFIDAEPEGVVEEFSGRFFTLSEAFMSSTSLGTCLLQHLRGSARCQGAERSRNSLDRHRDSLIKSVHHWNRAFEPIFAQSCQNPASRDYVGAALLHTGILALEIMIFTSGSKHEIVFDNFTDRFKRIIGLSRHVLEQDRGVQGADGLRVHQRGMGLTTSLFYAATRCRDSSLRREAMVILRKWPCIDGIWDSLQAANIAEWVMKLEEEGSAGTGFIPEECRVRMNSLKIIKQNNRVTMECIQGCMDDVSELRRMVF